MRNYIIRRLLLLIPTLLIVTIIVFCAVRFIPGNVVELMAAQHGGEAQNITKVIEDIKHQLGMDVPIYVQYFRWLGAVFRGDLGHSLWSERSIGTDFLQRLPVSVELGLMAIIVALLVAFPVGILSAIRQDTMTDYITRGIAILFISVPAFWIGTMIMVYPAKYLNWMPPVLYVPFFQDPVYNLKQFIIPALLLGMSMSGTTMRMTRTMMLEVLRQDYIRTAWAKGLKERVVVSRHALKNALIPVITIVGMQLPILVGGSVIMEQIFGLPGIGRYFIIALTSRDYPIVSAINLVAATFVMLCNLGVDIVYAYLDPRVQYR